MGTPPYRNWEVSKTGMSICLSKSRASKNQPVYHHFTPLEYAAILRYPCWRNPRVSESKSHSLRLDLKWATCFRWRLKKSFTTRNEIVCTAPLRIRFLSMDHLCDSLAMGWLACWRDCRSIYRTWCSDWNVAHHHGSDSAGLREYGWQRLCHHGIGKKWPVTGGHHRGVCSRHLYHVLRLRMHHAPAVHENCSSCSGSFHTLCYDSTHRDPGSEYWEPGFLQSCLFAFCTLGVWGKSVFAREREREMFKKEQGHQIHSVKWSLQTCSHHGICRWFSPPLGFGPNKTNGKCQRCLENSFWQLDIDRFQLNPSPWMGLRAGACNSCEDHWPSSVRLNSLGSSLQLCFQLCAWKNIKSVVWLRSRVWALNRGMLPVRLDLGISAWIHHPQMIDRLPKFAVVEAAGRDCLEEKWW